MAQSNFYDLIGFAPRHTEPRAGVPEISDLGKVALFLDFDGTLVDIAARPDSIEVPADLLDLLTELHDRTSGRTVVVSGRKMEDLKAFLPGFPGIMVGSHGAEILDRNELSQHELVGSEALRCISRTARAWADQQTGVLVEDKPCSVVLHFRRAPRLMAKGDRFLSAIVEGMPEFRLHHAKMALEVHPADVSKRQAVERLLERWPGCLPVALGDDATDEGMFEAANDRGGVSVKVGPEETAAEWRLGDPGEVRAALRRWIEEADAGTP